MEGFNGMPSQAGRANAAHTGRNIFIVIGAVLIITVGILVFFHERGLILPATEMTPVTNTSVAPSEPVTTEAKVQVLEAVSASSSSGVTTADRAKVLQSVQSNNTTPPPSVTDKMKLLESVQQ